MHLSVLDFGQEGPFTPNLVVIAGAPLHLAASGWTNFIEFLTNDWVITTRLRVPVAVLNKLRTVAWDLASPGYGVLSAHLGEVAAAADGGETIDSVHHAACALGGKVAATWTVVHDVHMRSPGAAAPRSMR